MLFRYPNIDLALVNNETGILGYVVLFPDAEPSRGNRPEVLDNVIDLAGDLAGQRALAIAVGFGCSVPGMICWSPIVD